MSISTPMLRKCCRYRRRVVLLIWIDSEHCSQRLARCKLLAPLQNRMLIAERPYHETSRELFSKLHTVVL